MHVMFTEQINRHAEQDASHDIVSAQLDDTGRKSVLNRAVERLMHILMCESEGVA